MFLRFLIPLLAECLPLLLLLFFLHFLRRAIGSQSLHIVMGLIIFLSLLVAVPLVASRKAIEQITQTDINLTIAVLPVFIMLLLIYEIHGTMETQRVILGIIITLIIATLSITFFINSFTGAMFVNNHEGQAVISTYFDALRKSSLIYTFTTIFLLFGLPILFQLMRNLRVPFFLTIFTCAALAGSLQSLTVYWNYPNSPSIVNHLLTLQCAHIANALAVALLATIYRFIIRPPEDHGARRSFSIITDIFRYFQTTEGLRKSMEEWESKYQAVINHSSELIILLNPHGIVTNTNASAYKILKNHLDAPLNVRDFITDENGNPFSLPDNYSNTELTAPTEKPLLFTNMKITLHDAAPIDIDFSLVQASVDGDVIAVLIARDMTQPHQQEKLRRELQEQFFKSQRIESIGILAGGIAHDFNNMLHAIRGNTDALLQSKDLTQTEQSYIQNIDTATTRAAELTSKLLGFARQGNYTLSTFSASHLVQQTADLFKNTARNITFKVLISPDPLFIRGDFTQIQQVLLNLLINAKDAIPEGTENPKITLRLEEANEKDPAWQNNRPQKDANAHDFLAIRVKDNGTGISPKIAEHLFEPFFTTKEINKGTGMGLAMAYGCITNHKGWISVLSKPTIQGTEFTIFLPRENAS